jgi:hypothetical protein
LKTKAATTLKNFLRFIPMAAVMGMIFYLSHQPGDTFPFPRFAGLDKAAHGTAYGCLAGTFLYGLHPFTRHSRRAAAAIVVVLFCFLFGISDEFHQSFIPGRLASPWDVAADLAGALVVVVWWYRNNIGHAPKDYP